MRTSKARAGRRAGQACHRRWSAYGKHLPLHTQGGSRMRESRTYGSVRGACDETHVPTATQAGLHHAPRRRGGCVAARGARAAAVPVIGYFSGRSPASDGPMLSAFRQGFSETGFVEGRKVGTSACRSWSTISFVAKLRLLSPVVARPRHRRPRRRPRLFQSSSISGATPWRRALSPVSADQEATSPA